MITLDNIRKSAQREADRDRRPMTIFNLNRYSPLYVVRLAQEGDAQRAGFVETIQPKKDTSL
jgi:hypothetical protein